MTGGLFCLGPRSIGNAPQKEGVYQDEVYRRLPKNLLNALMLIRYGFGKPGSPYVDVLIRIRQTLVLMQITGRPVIIVGLSRHRDKTNTSRLYLAPKVL